MLLAACAFLAERFEPGRRYSEAEVNELLRTDAPDPATLRRLLVDEGTSPVPEARTGAPRSRGRFGRGRQLRAGHRPGVRRRAAPAERPYGRRAGAAYDACVPAAVRLVHPAPTLAVVALSAALGAILLAQVGRPLNDPRLLLVVVSVLGSQVATGALNDWADRDRDRLAQPDKPLPAGELSPRSALVIAATGFGLQAVTSLALSPTTFAIGSAAVASATAYNLWLSRTPLSVLPYLVSFCLLPIWIAAGVGVAFERVAGAALLAGPFAAAAHLANTTRDFDVDAAVGSRALAQTIGRGRAFVLAWTLAIGVGVAVGWAFAVTGRLTVATAALGLVGLVAVAQGIAGPRQLWYGILVAAVAWTVAWAVATG